MPASVVMISTPPAASSCRGSPRPRAWPGLCALLLAGLASSTAQGQGLPSNAAEPREGEEVKGDAAVAEIREVERGFYFSVDAGPNYYLGIGGKDLFSPYEDFIGRSGFSLQPFGFVNVNEGWLSPGQRIGLRIGYDILNNLNAEFALVANFNRGLVNRDDRIAGRLSGDVAHFAPALAMRFAFFTTERWFVYGRGGLGLAIWSPAGMAPLSVTGLLLPDLSVGLHTQLSLGVEYYTHLRHLSIGFEVAGQGLIFPFAFGVAAYPTVKYTF